MFGLSTSQVYLYGALIAALPSLALPNGTNKTAPAHVASRDLRSRANSDSPHAKVQVIIPEFTHISDPEEVDPNLEGPTSLNKTLGPYDLLFYRFTWYLNEKALKPDGSNEKLVWGYYCETGIQSNIADGDEYKFSLKTTDPYVDGPKNAPVYVTCGTGNCFLDGGCSAYDEPIISSLGQSNDA